MKDPYNKQVMMTHDGYLKLFCLTKPVLSEWDVILIDEAQDLTPGLFLVFIKDAYNLKIYKASQVKCVHKIHISGC